MNAKALYPPHGVGTHRNMPPRADLKWIALDHDGTMARSTWSPSNPTSEIGAPIPENVVKALCLVAEGWKLVVHTARPWSDYEALEAWYEHYDIPIRSIVCGKILALAYIDDRAVAASDGDWVESVYRLIGEH